jgi:soluble lytic murein transglycosylase-like protein
MRRNDLLWFVGGALLLAALTGGVIVMSDWKKRAVLAVGQAQFDYLMGLLNAAESKYGMPRDLLAAQAYAESAFDTNAVSSAGAQGLMQLMPQYYAGVDPFDPVQAIEAAAATDAANYRRFGSWTLALAAYNAGAGNVAKYGNTVPPFAETQGYVSKILGFVNSEGGTQVA